MLPQLAQKPPTFIAPLYNSYRILRATLREPLHIKVVNLSNKNLLKHI